MATLQVLPEETPFAVPELSAGLARLRSSSRAESARAAQDAVLVAELAGRVPRVLGDERGGSAWTSLVREVAVARRCSDRAATSEIARALQLVRLPLALGLLAAGDLPVLQVRALVEESWPASDATLARIDAEVSQRAVTLSPSRVRDAVRKVLLREEADAVAAQAAKATAARGAAHRPLADDQAELVLTGPAVPLNQLWAAVDHDARALRAAGDPRTLDALRFDLLVDRGLAGHVQRGPVAPGAPPAAALAAPAEDSAAPPAPPAATPRAAPPEGSAVPSAAAPPAAASPPIAPPEATNGPAWLIDRRWSRPVRQNISVPVTTTLGLSNEPGWLDGHGWISAPTCRQLLVASELRRLAVDQESGQLVDVAPDVERPPLTPEAVAAALRDMASRPFDVTDTSWQAEPQHDPGPALRELVALRDEQCDGPTGVRVPARRADQDHDTPYPAGPTAAWNLVVRSERTHQLKHRGWTPVRTPSSTLWFSPAGQVAEVPRSRGPLQPLDQDARLPDPLQLHALEAELLRPPDADDDPPDW